MKLIIDNVAKVFHADIELNGITVIAGENCTGKSTVGKVLYCIYESQYDLNNKIREYKHDAIERSVRLLFIKQALRKREYENLINTIMDLSENGTVTYDSVFSLMKELILDSDSKEDMEIYYSQIEDIAKRIQSICLLEDKDIEESIIQRYFDTEFDKQVNYINDEEEIASVKVIVKDKNINLNFVNNKLVYYEKEINLISEAMYVDSPFVIDDINNSYFSFEPINHRNDLIYKMSIPSSMKEIISETINKKRFTTILESLDQIIPGEINSFEDEKKIKLKDMKQPLHVTNLATGVKTFLTLKTLILNGYISDKTVLVLDEPEIHLHPKWQQHFAELVVLLQKEFELTILINTHSPYFLKSIEVYSAKHKIADKCKYYLSENKEQKSSIRDVTRNTEEIYRLLAAPLKELNDIQYRGE